jgi:hypothetical protein
MMVFNTFIYIKGRLDDNLLSEFFLHNPEVENGLGDPLLLSAIFKLQVKLF